MKRSGLLKLTRSLGVGGLIVTSATCVVAQEFTVKWKVPINGQSGTISLGADGTIYVPTYSSLQALNPDGNQKWVVNMSSPIVRGGAVVLADGGLMTGLLDFAMRRSDASGQQVWSTSIPDGTSQGIAVSGANDSYLAGRAGTLYAFAPDGVERWTFPTGDQLYGGPVIGKDGTIYFGSNDNKLYALNPGGTKKWDLDLGSGIQMSPAIGENGVLYVGTYGQMHAVSTTGIKLWSYSGLPDNSVWSPALGTNGTVYFGNLNKLIALTPAGNLSWQVVTDQAYATPVVLVDGSLLVHGSNSRLHHYNSDGTLRREYTDLSYQSYPIPPTVAPDGTVYIENASGELVALDGGLAPADSAWPMFQHDLARTGRVPPLPFVDLLLPVNSSIYVSGHPVPVRAKVLNLSPVDRVDFYRGAVLLQSDSSPPFETSWASSGTAPQTFSAVAHSGSLSITSAPTSITLLPSQANTLPLVQIVSPTNNSSPLAGGELRIAAQASDPDGAVLSVEFFDGTTSLGSAAYPDFVVSVNPLGPGTHLLTAVATDNYGGKGTSAVVRAYAVQKMWEYDLQPYQSYGSPALGTNGQILFGASEWIHALDTAGNETWVAHLDGVGVSTGISVADDGTLYFGTSNSRLYARTPNGDPKWDFALDGQVLYNPALGADGTIYMGGSGGKLFAVLPSGIKKWEYSAPGNLATPPVIGGDGSIVFGTGNGNLTSLDEAGEFQWEFYVDGGILSPPAVGADGTLYFSSANVGKFFALTPQGVQKWMLPTASGVATASPSIGIDGTIYCGTTGGYLLAILPNGTLKWSLNLGGEIRGTPAVATDGSLYIGSDPARKFFHVSPSGAKLWEYASSSVNFAVSPLILDNGDVLASNTILLGGTSGPAGGPWPMFLQNRRHTGRAWVGPVPKLTSPVAETIYTLGDAIPLGVDVSASLNPVTKVEYLSDSNLVTTVASTPFATTWNAPAGVHYVQARATDSFGAIRTSGAARIKVVPPGTGPSLLASPVTTTTVDNGATVVLSVDVFGSGPLTYTWFKDGVLVPGATGPDLTLSSAAIGDAANYYVRVTNGFGQVQTTPSVVNVLQPVMARWMTSSGTQIHTTPAVGEGGILRYADDGGDLTAYDPRGNYEWWFLADLVPNGDLLFSDRIRSSPVLDTNGVALFATHGGRFYLINPDGTRRRRVDLAYGTDSSPALGTNGDVYFGSGGGSLLAYTKQGDYRWTSPVSGSVNSAPAIGPDANIYFTSEGALIGNNLYSGRLNSVTPNGGFRWAYLTGDLVASSPAIGADGTAYFGSRDHKFYAVGANGSKLWDFTTDGPIFGSAVVGADGTIYFGNVGAFNAQLGINQGHLYALTPAGQLKWSFQAGAEIQSTPALAADGTIYFGADDGNVYALNPNGTLRWKYQTNGKIQSGLTIGFDGTVYAGSFDGQLYALFENPSPLANSPWPKFKHDLRGTSNVTTTNDAPAWVFPFASNAFNDEVKTIAVQGTDVFVGGAFTIAGGRLANHVARWDGHQWSALGGGLDGLVLSLAWYNGELYAGGDFQQAAGQDIRYLARWNGSAWSTVGGGVNNQVRQLAVLNGSLFVGGQFGSAGSADVNGMARWDGTDWFDTGNNAPVSPTALAVINGTLYAAAGELGPPGDRSYGILRWNGTGWDEVSRGFNDEIWALAYYNGQLCAGGRFTQVGILPVNGIAQWSGTAWESLAGGMFHWLTPRVNCLTVFDGGLFAGGLFLQAGGVEVNNLARWNGSSWSALGTGLTRASQNSLPVASALATQGNSLLVGGVFLAANDNRDVRYFARWRNGALEALGEKLNYSDGAFHLTLFPERGVSYGIEVSTDLIHWERITTFTGLEDAEEFIDEDSSLYPQRFYRAVTP